MYRAKPIDAFMRERYVCLRTHEDAVHAISAKRREQIGRPKPFRFRKGGFLYAKLLRKLNDEYAALLGKEAKSKEFNAAVGENVESVRPEYSYTDAQESQKELEGKIRKLKHAVNVFNATHVVPGFDMTIDEMLVYIPQLTRRKAKLAEMKAKLPKSRVSEVGARISNVIDYTYLNYDLAEVEADYERVSDELSDAQLALDAVNSSETFEFDF